MGCPPAVREALLACEGVKDAKINFATKSARVIIEGEVDPATLIAAVDAAGFEGTGLKKN